MVYRQKIFKYSSRALLRNHKETKTPCAGGHAGVSPSHGTGMAPRGHKNVSLRRLSCPCYYSCGFPPPRYGRGGAEGIKTYARARFFIPRTAHWFQRSFRVPTLLLMLREGGWERAGPSDSLELANLTSTPPPTPPPPPPRLSAPALPARPPHPRLLLPHLRCSSSCCQTEHYRHPVLPSHHGVLGRAPHVVHVPIARHPTPPSPQKT